MDTFPIAFPLSTATDFSTAFNADFGVGFTLSVTAGSEFVTILPERHKIEVQPEMQVVLIEQEAL